MTSRSPYRVPQSGFTLIELLVSFAVLAALVALLASAFSNFAGLTSSSGRRLEANNQSRTVFDRLGFDISSSIRNSEVKLNFKKNEQAWSGSPGVNDSLTLLADARSTQGDSRLARIGYEVETSRNEASGISVKSLNRLVEPFQWSDSVSQNQFGGSVEPQPLGWGVFRLEFSFLKTDGTLVASPPPADEMAAIICSTASLDEKTYAQLSDEELNRLSGCLQDAADGKLPLSDWNVSRFVGFPPAVSQNVRFQQRQFFLK